MLYFMKSYKRYTMSYGISNPPVKKVLKWKIGTLFQKKEKSADDDFKLPVQTLRDKDLEQDEDFIVWLGHATFYIQLDGVRILTDPVIGSVPFVPRLADFPIDPAALKPDIVLISHGHYDHLDLNSLEKLGVYEKQTKIIMPSSLSSYIKKDANISELAWYEAYESDKVGIVALPASHWHRRGLFDFNRALWCSFVIKSKDKTLFFAGDTAFDTHFMEIQNKISSIDIALMPIGAYEPREIMKENHMNPQEALNASEILKAGEMIPYHYGTFKLTAEPVGEPHSWMTRLAQESRIKVHILDIGEIKKL